jgi:hypothetical protein
MHACFFFFSRDACLWSGVHLLGALTQPWCSRCIIIYITICR